MEKVIHGKTVSKAISTGKSKKSEAVKEYYEAESWQFSGCGD